MSKNFSMRLSDYVIARTAGNNQNVLHRTVDIIDVYSILNDEGFTNFSERRAVHRIHGRDLSNLRDRISEQLVGVPRDAYIDIDCYGPGSDFLVIKLAY